MQLSYYVVDLMIWLGIRDIINDFRKTQLKKDSVSFHTVSQIAINTPHGYIWSPSLVPKPKGMSRCFFHERFII
jgi:sterol 3beta-glucosyltransferase